MTIGDQKRWSKKIKELESKAAELEMQAGDQFSYDECFNLLINANKELSLELSEKKWGKGIDEFLKDNSKVNEVLNRACDDLDRAFDIKSITVIKLRIKKYKEAYKFVEMAYSEARTSGFRELTADEINEEDKNLEQIGWI